MIVSRMYSGFNTAWIAYAFYQPTIWLLR